MKSILRILAIPFALLFAWAILLQLNDSDMFFWMLVYAIPAAFAVATAGNRWSGRVALLLGATYVLAAAFMFPGFVEDYLNNEVFREAGGLLIGGVWLLALGFASYAGAEKRLIDHRDPSDPRRL